MCATSAQPWPNYDTMTGAACSLMDRAVAILATADPKKKIERTGETAGAWKRQELQIGRAHPPARPARPERPELLAPGAMPKRSTGPKRRRALIHALAHIELNAIDLAWDLIARFGNAMPRAFLDDWVGVAEEEAQHFEILASQLAAWDSAYGDLPAHDGLWQAAASTADDLSARLVVVPLTLEARGLDVTPQTAARFRKAGDIETASTLDKIYADEIKHLAAGIRWFEFACSRDGRNPETTYQKILTERFTGTLKGPFNLPARARAGMGAGYLTPWLPAQ